MIQEIHIENMAVIESLAVKFESGFTVLTGETGVGKSLLIQALGLIAGHRAQAEAVREGQEQALVEARLRPASESVAALLAEQGYEGDGNELVVRRLIRADGNHRVYVNGRMATAGLLQDIVAPELEIHAQHSQQQLLSEATQRALLDRYGDHAQLLQAVENAFAAWHEIRTQIEQLEDQAGRRDQELDYLRYQLHEFESLDPQPDEMDSLQAKLARLRGGAQLLEAVAAAQELLHDGEGSALDQVFTAQDGLARAIRFAPELEPIADRLQALADELRTLCRDLPVFDGENEQENLAQLEERLASLQRLVRKHGDSMQDALAARAQMQQSVADLEDAEATLARLSKQEITLRQAYDDAAEALSKARQKTAEEMSGRVTEGLRELEMPHAVFSVAGWGESEPRRHGVDKVMFMLAANPGDRPRPLRNVASGGELSRILLVLHTIIGLQHDGATIVLDEADTGIGGNTALTVGRRMRALGERAQVLVVTHTPQVAGQAHHQIHLEKGLRDGRACTFAHNLDYDARITELAGMLGVRDTATAIEHARTLLAVGPS